MIDAIDTYEDPDPPLIRDADIQMAEGVREANRLYALEKSGVCVHNSTVGYAGGRVFYAEQEGLKPGQVACRDHTNGCTAVFDSDEEWYEARLAL